jgi:DNA-binding MarR family transcriptional regulator
MADQPGRERRRRVAAVTNALRDLRIELAVLNHRVGVHLATMTGILNRLEEAGWVTRERSASDRRAVVVAASRPGSACCSRPSGR